MQFNDYNYRKIGCAAADALQSGNQTFEQIERAVLTLPEIQPARHTMFYNTPAVDPKGEFWLGYYERLGQTGPDSSKKQ